MPQIILHERTAHLASYTFLQEILINIKHVNPTALSTAKNTFFHRTLITSYVRPSNIAKFLRTSFLQNTSISSRLRMFFQTGVLKTFANFTEKHLCWSRFLKKLQAGSFIKKTPTQVISCEVCKNFKNTFSYSTTPVAASVFFLKKYY